jgi:sugar O-acyltransferase (sialic acid O-acetyltransferase NeuD family)
MQKKLVIFGYTEFAEIAYEYFTHDSDYTVAGFCVHKEYITKTELFGLPIVPFEEVEKHFAPSDHSFFAASVYTKLNRLRTKVMSDAKEKGYQLASYVSSHSFVWRNVKLGEHVFIFEDNTVQPFVEIGSNVVLWSGNHIGHHSKVGDNCFISSHVVVSGGVNIGKNCFLGVNSTINNAVTIGDDCVLASGALVVKDIPENSVVKGKDIDPKKTGKELFNV